MLTDFKSYIVENRLCSTNDKILVTVSGGIDSIVLLDLAIHAGYYCGIAHCNFKLRGEESDEDEEESEDDPFVSHEEKSCFVTKKRKRVEEDIDVIIRPFKRLRLIDDDGSVVNTDRNTTVNNKNKIVDMMDTDEMKEIDNLLEFGNKFLSGK